ncbi:MAG: PD40 domain-containing protein [Candidatus Yanofskybacteria bacterium]|nr:PD40 domain-containing protein [Candidatus Yanofskybacteria bacterium]
MKPFRANLNFVHERRIASAGVVIGALVATVVVTAFVWSGVAPRSRQTASIANIPADTTPPQTLSPKAVRVAPEPISEHAVSSVAHSRTPDTVRYYEQETGRAFQVDLRTLKTETLSDRKLPGFIQSFWVPNADAVVSLFDEAGSKKYRYYDYQTRTAKTIGSAVSTLAVSPSGRRIAFIDTTGEYQALYIGDTDGTAVRKVFDTRAQHVALSWPREDALVLTSRRPDRAGTDMSVIGLNGELRVLMSNRENLEYTWSPDGSNLLFSYFFPGRGITLWYRSLDSALEIPVPLATSAWKCAWHNSNEKITCGVPTTTLSRDVASDKTATIDTIATIDLRSGKVSNLYTGSREPLIGVINPSISSSQRYFVFTNLFDRRLMELELPAY